MRKPKRRRCRSIYPGLGEEDFTDTRCELEQKHVGYHVGTHPVTKEKFNWFRIRGLV